MEELENSLLSIEKVLKKEKLKKKEKEKYAKLYQQGLFLKYVMIEIESNREHLDDEYIRFENENVKIYCEKVSKYLQC